MVMAERFSGLKIIHRVWEGFGVCCTLFELLMVLPFGFYIRRFLRRQILQNSYSVTSLFYVVIGSVRQPQMAFELMIEDSRMA